MPPLPPDDAVTPPTSRTTAAPRTAAAPGSVQAALAATAADKPAPEADWEGEVWPTERQQTDGTGLLWFAGTVLALVGALQAIQGIVALADPGYYDAPASRLAVDVGYTTWGWVHLVIGIVALATGLGLLTGNVVARFAGVALAVISAVVNLAFVAANPWWSFLAIAFDVLVIYAITTSGEQGTPAR